MFVASVTALWYFACDIVYVVLFPQLLCVLFIPFTHPAGAVSGYWVGLILRFLAGEKSLSIPSVTKYPMYNYETDEQLFPFRTFVMMMNLLVCLVVSALVNHWNSRRQRVFALDKMPKELELHKQNLHY